MPPLDMSWTTGDDLSVGGKTAHGDLTGCCGGGGLATKVGFSAVVLFRMRPPLPDGRPPDFTKFELVDGRGPVDFELLGC